MISGVLDSPVADAVSAAVEDCAVTVEDYVCQPLERERDGLENLTRCAGLGSALQSDRPLLV